MLLVLPFAVAMAIDARLCTIESVEYSVGLTDANGRVEYCVGRHFAGGRGHPAYTDIAPGATCGQNKGELLVAARTMSKASADAVAACRAQPTLDAVQSLWNRWFGE